MKIASGSSDKTIKIWNIKNSKCELTLKGHDSKTHINTNKYLRLSQLLLRKYRWEMSFVSCEY